MICRSLPAEQDEGREEERLKEEGTKQSGYCCQPEIIPKVHKTGRGRGGEGEERDTGS